MGGEVWSVTQRTLLGHGAQVGIVVASGVVPTTFAASLSERTWSDQGLITGLATGAHFLLSAAAQTAIDAAGAALSTALPFPASWSGERRASTATVLLDLALVPVGLGAAQLLGQCDGDTAVRDIARRTAWRLGATGLGASALAGAREITDSLDRAVGAGGRLSRLPIAIPVGLAANALIERFRQHQHPPEHHTDPARTNTVLGLAAGAGVVLSVATAAMAESWLSHALGSVSSRTLPGSEATWHRVAQVVTLGSLSVGIHGLWSRAMVRVEAGTTAYQDGMDEEAGREWTIPTMSGDPASLVSWQGLGREGRRHVSAYVRPQPAVDRRLARLLDGRDVQDRSIETVMQEEPRATPIGVYVGLDHAPTAQARVDLALAEMDRTDAWSRSLIMLVSPTGTGYVNYVAVAAAQYLTRGDVATVTLQYSKRPSPLSLGKIGQAREQNRLLWLRILARVRQMPPEDRPKVVVFGESLGAQTSQAPFAGWGTLGPEALGIDRALWIGTPAASTWYQELQVPGRIDVDRTSIAIVNDYEQYQALGDEARREIRYVLLSHDNDGVTKFSPELLARRPAWLGPDRPIAQELPGRSPRGIPASMRWRPVTTFLQLLVDMKNAQIPGAYRAWAHDYRPDLPDFVRDVFALKCSDEQLERIKAACEDRERLRQSVFS
jgi:uncharacterized membrane protein